MRKIFEICKDWSEVILLLPLTLLLVLSGGFLVRLIDPTAAWLDAGNLSILIFNALAMCVINGLAFFLYKINFGDFFTADWVKTLPPAIAAVLNAILWLSTLLVSCWVLLRNL